jgi:hypothetical protein
MLIPFAPMGLLARFLFSHMLPLFADGPFMRLISTDILLPLIEFTQVRIAAVQNQNISRKHSGIGSRRPHIITIVSIHAEDNHHDNPSPNRVVDYFFRFTGGKPGAGEGGTGLEPGRLPGKSRQGERRGGNSGDEQRQAQHSENRYDSDNSQHGQPRMTQNVLKKNFRRIRHKSGNPISVHF